MKSYLLPTCSKRCGRLGTPSQLGPDGSSTHPIRGITGAWTEVSTGPEPHLRILKIRSGPDIASSTGEQTAEARITTILQSVEQKPHSQKDRQHEKAEGYVPDEGTR